MSEADIDAAILGYYLRGEEQARLTAGCRLELVRTQEILGRVLPPAPARVLDVGGGAGVHALPLIERGYDVTLIDPVPLHVTQARAAGVADARAGDARRLDVEDASADAVLLLGPLYHLITREDRLAALREARRVTRPGGTLVAAAISRFASTLDGLLGGFLLEAEFEEIVERDVASGEHRNPHDREGWFTTAYFHRPDELAEEVAAAGWTVDALLAVEGAGAPLADVDTWLDDPHRREVLLRAIRRLEAEPSLLGASPHLLVTARARR